MRLRKPCQHGLYDDHYTTWRDPPRTVLGEHCPGGEFLADDALVIEKVEGQWPIRVVAELADLSVTSSLSFPMQIRQNLDALTVREGAE